MGVPHILLAAEDPDFALLIQLSFQESGILNPIHVVSDGREALSYLNGEGRYSSRSKFPLPSVLLIDSRLRHMPGFEVVRWIKEQPGLRDSTIVLFTRGTETDARLAEDSGADYYLAKPFDFRELITIVQGIGRSWLPTENLAQLSTLRGIPFRSPQQDIS